MEARVRVTANIEEVIELKMTITELRTMIHRLAGDGTYLKMRSEHLLPENHQDLADNMAETLRRLHDKEIPADAL